MAATGHKLCLVGVSGPGPCARASFVPTGAGAMPAAGVSRAANGLGYLLPSAEATIPPLAAQSFAVVSIQPFPLQSFFALRA